jgi:rubrerythrin
MAEMSINDLFALTITVEKNASGFYEMAALIADDKEQAKFFKSFADEEKIHRGMIEDILKHYQNPQNKMDNATRDIGTLVRKLEQSIAQNMKQWEKISQEGNFVALLNFFMAREQDTINLYQNMTYFIRPEYRFQVEQILNDEKNHLKYLMTIKQSYLKATQKF